MIGFRFFVSFLHFSVASLSLPVFLLRFFLSHRIHRCVVDGRILVISRSGRVAAVPRPVESVAR